MFLGFLNFDIKKKIISINMHIIMHINIQFLIYVWDVSFVVILLQHNNHYFYDFPIPLGWVRG